MGKIKGKLTTAEHLSMPDFLRLIQGLHDDGLYLWELHACISFSTGFRGSDVLSLKWKDVLNKNTLQREEKKTKKVREIPFNTEVRKKISGLHLLMGSPEVDEYIFRSTRFTTPYTIEYVNKMLKKFHYNYRLPIKSMSTHTYRKTFGRFVYETLESKSEALVLLNSIFKHTSLDITRRYIGIEQDQKNQVYGNLRLS